MTAWLRTAARALGVAALTAYASLLVLGAWREEVRPSFLDVPSRAAKRWLLGAGIPVGMAVFSSEERQTSILLAHCITVRARRPDSVPFLVSGEDPCPPRGLILHRDPGFTLEQRLCMELARHMTVLQSAPDSPAARAAAQRMLKSLAHHYTLAARRIDPEITDLALEWTSHVRDRSGALRVQPLLFLAWQPGALSELQPRWLPRDPERHWSEWSPP